MTPIFSPYCFRLACNRPAAGGCTVGQYYSGTACVSVPTGKGECLVDVMTTEVFAIPVAANTSSSINKSHRERGLLNAARHAISCLQFFIHRLIFVCLPIAGHYNPTAGSNVYYACPLGSYRTLAGYSSCVLAAASYYMPFPGSLVSWSCATSLMAGAVVCNSGRVTCGEEEEVA